MLGQRKAAALICWAVLVVFGVAALDYRRPSCSHIPVLLHCLAGTDVRLTMTFSMPYSKISSNVAEFAADVQNEIVALTQLPGTHVTTLSVRDGNGVVIAVVDAFFDVELLRTYAEATTFAMNAQVSPILLTRSAFNAAYAPVTSSKAEIRPRFAGELCTNTPHAARSELPVA